MADTDDTTTEAMETGGQPVRLLANSYDFQELLKATKHAEGLKKPDARDEAFAKIAVDKALNQDVLKGQSSIAVPEGTELADVETLDGQMVKAPVSLREQVEEAEKSRDKTPTGGGTPGTKA